MTNRSHWSLGAKLALVAAPFLLLALVSVAATLWVSWQLEGGAAAVNEAGRMRMQAYRLSLSVGTADAAAVPGLVHEFNAGLELLRHGDAARPLFVPWDDEVRRRFAEVERDWQAFHRRWANDPAAAAAAAPAAALRADAAGFTAHIDAMVAGIEAHMSRWTTLLHLLQLAVLALAVAGAATLVYTGYRFVLEPVAQLLRAIERIQGGDFSTRVPSGSTDEFGTLAAGFNELTGHLLAMYRNLEAKVAEKTAELHEKRERLEALYDVTTLMANAGTLDELAAGFTERIARVARADGVALRWTDQANQRYLMLASKGLPGSMVDGEQCLVAGTCHCGDVAAPAGTRVIPIQSAGAAMQHCTLAGFQTMVSVPVRLHDHTLGEVDLFFHAGITLSGPERSLLDALAAHLATAMDNLRLAGLAKEAAVSQERNLLARELHDSIAQSLAFLKIQVQLMRDALDSGNLPRVASVLEEIDTGVRESYGDVRELLVHFRTRANTEDIAPALQTTLRKFEHQSGVKATLRMQGHGLPIAPDLQLQVLHIVQEALSNVRKHARATQVWLEVRQQPQWCFEVRDDGCGFDADGAQPNETHVGLRIMRERAERIGAELDVVSTRGKGASVVLTLPASAPAALPAAKPAAKPAALPAARPTALPPPHPTLH